jgi:hypothetical protein
MVAASMDPAVWGLIGTVVGALIVIAGNFLVHRDEMDERIKREQRESTTRAREECKEVYIRLLASARQLRYRARHGAVFVSEEINSLRSELSNAHYEIELIACREVVSSADALVRSVLDYVNQARKQVSADDNTVQASTALEEKREMARAAVNQFIVTTRKDLGRTQPKPEGRPRLRLHRHAPG